VKTANTNPLQAFPARSFDRLLFLPIKACNRFLALWMHVVCLTRYDLPVRVKLDVWYILGSRPELV
jgi:hypothetical protein